MQQLWAVNDRWDPTSEGVTAPRLEIADCTLRDGEQQAGIVFTAQDKIDIARALDDAGVHEIEAGTPAVSSDDFEAVSAIAQMGLKARVSALSRARASEIAQVAQTGAWAVRLSLPIGDLQRTKKLRLSNADYLALAIEMTETAKANGLAVIFSPFDTTRADEDFLREVLGELSRRQTVDRVRLVDTVGVGTPGMIRHLVRLMRESCDMELEIHCHDDFGLAVANTIAGALAGAEHLSVTVNGLGERSGNAALEEVVVALRVLYGKDLGIDLSRLVALSELVQERSGIALARHKAVVGTGAFAHESGMVVAGLLEDPFTAEPYTPDLVGGRREIILGKKSGLVSLQARLRQLGLDTEVDDAEALLEAVKTTAIERGSALTDDDVRDLIGARRTTR